MVNFEEATLVKGAYVEINGVEYPVHMPQYSGGTHLSPENMNKLQNDLKNDIKVNIITDQEVVTNEYREGKRVYVKRIDCGNAPNNDSKDVPHGLSNITVVKLEGIAYTSDHGLTYPLPFAYADGDRISIWIYQNNITIATWRDKSDFHCYVDVYYTKNNE